MLIPLFSSIFSCLFGTLIIILISIVIMSTLHKLNRYFSDMIVNLSIKDSISFNNYINISNITWEESKISFRKRSISLKNCCFTISKYVFNFRKFDINFSLNFNILNSSNGENSQVDKQIKSKLSFFKKKISIYDFTISNKLQFSEKNRNTLDDNINRLICFLKNIVTSSSFKEINDEKVGKAFFTISCNINEYITKNLSKYSDISEITIHSLSFEFLDQYSSKIAKKNINYSQRKNKSILIESNKINILNKINIESKYASILLNQFSLCSQIQESDKPIEYARKNPIFSTEYAAFDFYSLPNKIKNQCEVDFKIRTTSFPIEDEEFSKFIKEIEIIFSSSHPLTNSFKDKEKESSQIMKSSKITIKQSDDNQNQKKPKHIGKIKMKNQENLKETAQETIKPKTAKKEEKQIKKKRCVRFSEPNLKSYLKEDKKPNIKEKDKEKTSSNEELTSELQPTPNQTVVQNSVPDSILKESTTAQPSTKSISATESESDINSKSIQKADSAPLISTILIPVQINSDSNIQSNPNETDPQSSLGPPPPPPPPPPPAPSSQNSLQAQQMIVIKGIKTRSIFWKKVNRTSLDGTIWGSINQRGIENDFDLDNNELSNFAHIFSQKSNSSLSNNNSENGNNQSNSVVQLVSSQKAKATAILLSGLKMQPETILKRVFELDYKSFTESQLQTMLKNAPDQDDYNAIDQFKEDKRKLGICEKYSRFHKIE